MAAAAALRAPSPARMFAASPSSSGAGPSTLSSETCSILSRRAPEIKVNCVCVCFCVHIHVFVCAHTFVCVWWMGGGRGAYYLCENKDAKVNGQTCPLK